MAEQEVIDLGIVGISNKGEYNSQVMYEKLNVVTYEGSSYCAKQNSRGVLPTNTDYWQLYAEKGEKGDTGAQGPIPEKGVDYFTAEDKAEFSNEISAEVQNEVSEQIGSLTSATPLAASSTSDMLDTSRIYVNTTDNYWYYYNGSNWVAGGLYQATQMSNENQDAINTVEFFINLFNSNYNLAFPILGFIKDDGSLDTRVTSSYHVSNFLYIDLVKDLVMDSYISPTASVRLYNFYDSNKSFVGRSNDISDYTQYQTKYVRICRHNNYNGPKTLNSLSNLAVNNFYRNAGQKVVSSSEMKQGSYVYGTYNPDNTERICCNDFIPINSFPILFQIEEDYKMTVQFFGDTFEFIDYVDYFTYSNTVTPPQGAKYMLFNVRASAASTDIVPSDIVNANLNYTQYEKYNNKDSVLLDNNSSAKWSNKTINFIGDSISAGHNIGSQNAWPVVCCSKLGAICNNYAISGSTIADYNNEGLHTPIVNRFNEMSDDADLIIIMAGRNDYREVAMPMGNPDDNVPNTFYGALNILFNGLWQKYPTKQIIFITSYKAMVNTSPTQLRDSEWSNALGFKQIDYINAIKEKCKEFSIPVIDLYNGETITSWNPYQRPYYFIDTVHPSVQGAKFIGNLIASKLNNY